MSYAEVLPPRSESYRLGPVDEYGDAILEVRGMITVAIGVLKELSAQAVAKYNAPGMRFLIGEILSCLGSAKKATLVNYRDLTTKRV
jgi:hypothetical protein